jgi:MFS family permease
MPSSLQGFSALRYRNFALFLSARFLIQIAMQMQSVAIGWQIYAITGKALDLGLIGLAQFLPFAMLVLFAGQVADHYNKRWILVICFAIDLLCSLTLLAFTLSGPHDIWPVLAVLALHGAARAFMMPTGQAIVMSLVPQKHFSNAVAVGSSTFHLAVICGPTFGGLLYLAGPEVVFAAVSAIIALATVMMLLVRVAHPKQSGREPATWHTLLEGLRFVRSRPVVLGAISLDLFAVLFGGAAALLPAYANDILHVGPTGLGLLRTAPGVGAALTAMILVHAPIVRNVGYWMFGGVALFGLATCVFGLSENFAISLAALFLLGAGDMVSVYIRQILVQFETPDPIRGRVSAVNAVFIGASNELGEFESGLSVVLLGLVPAVVAGGAVTLIITALWMNLFPVLRRMDHFPHAIPSLPRSPPPQRYQPFTRRKQRQDTGKRRR